MSYTKENIIKESLEILESNHIISSFRDLFSLTSFGKDVFYRKIDKNSDEYEHIKKGIRDNRNKTKQLLKQKWFDSKQPTLQWALYKLLADKKEFNRIASNNIDIKGEIKQTKDLSNYTTEELIKRAEAIKQLANDKT